MFLLGVIDGSLDLLGSALGCYAFWRSPLDHFLVDGENMAHFATKQWFKKSIGSLKILKTRKC